MLSRDNLDSKANVQCCMPLLPSSHFWWCRSNHFILFTTSLSAVEMYWVTTLIMVVNGLGVKLLAAEWRCCIALLPYAQDCIEYSTSAVHGTCIAGVRVMPGSWRTVDSLNSWWFECVFDFRTSRGATSFLMMPVVLGMQQELCQA